MKVRLHVFNRVQMVISTIFAVDDTKMIYISIIGIVHYNGNRSIIRNTKMIVVICTITAIDIVVVLSLA